MIQQRDPSIAQRTADEIGNLLGLLGVLATRSQAGHEEGTGCARTAAGGLLHAMCAGGDVRAVGKDWRGTGHVTWRQCACARDQGSMCGMVGGGRHIHMLLGQHQN